MFRWQNCEKVKVIRDYAKSISYLTMDNECHANICVFVQNSPNPPSPIHDVSHTEICSSKPQKWPIFIRKTFKQSVN